MKLNKLFNCLGIFVLGLSAFQAAQAGDKSVYKITTTTPAPSTMVSGRTAVAVYSVKNNAPIRLSHARLKNLPSTVSQVTPQQTTENNNNLCSNPIDLASGASCHLRLNVKGAVSASNAPTVCQGVYCATSATPMSVRVVSDPTGLPALSSTKAITLSPDNSVEIEVKNESSSVKANDINIKFPDSSVARQLTTSRSGCDSVSPEGTCTITVKGKSSASGKGFPGEVTIEGSNTKSTTTDLNFEDDLTVAVNSTPADQHLFYRALKVTNYSLTAEKLESVSLAGLDNKVKWCKKGDTSCDYQSTCTLDSEIAPKGGSCLLWFKAQTPASTPSLGPDSGTITVKGASGTADEFTATYSLDLYAGGQFTQTGDGRSLTNNIAKYNGTSWNDVGTEGGASDSVIGLATYKGDLYAGGRFINIGGAGEANHIAKWNGSRWTKLRKGISGGDIPKVEALTSLNGILYAAGQFKNASGKLANNVAQWNGSDWIPLKDGANNEEQALTTLNSMLYAGGIFTEAGGKLANHVANWDGSDWSALGITNFNGAVNALTTLGSDIYAGGGFTIAGAEANPANRIARWNGNSWTPLGDGLDDSVFATTSLGSNIIAGGVFSSAGDKANTGGIAKWNGEDWSALGSGTTGDVKALMSLGNNTLFAGGNFNKMSGVNDTHLIAQWNDKTSEWIPLGTGLSTGGGEFPEVSTLVAAPSLSLSL